MMVVLLCTLCNLWNYYKCLNCQLPLVTMKRRYMGAQQKHAILANDLVGRMVSNSIELQKAT